MKPLIILEMANNHAGSVDHGLSIIRAYSEICRPFIDNFEFVFKFQYRQLDSFIRKDMKDDLTIPLVKRFSETKLEPSQFASLLGECRLHGFGTMVTPFDEPSVKLAISQNVDYLKIASCSFGDWSLLESIVQAGKPVVASCAGASVEVIDNVVAFFRNRNVYLLLQHCVGNYPTSPHHMNVGQVSFLRNRYPSNHIGFSSHEDPSTINIAPLALAQGARSFEKHVALEVGNIVKNKYSTSPTEFLEWLQSLDNSAKILGVSDTRYKSLSSESASLRNLQRGAFVTRTIDQGQVVPPEDIFYAFPPNDDQITANDISKYTQITAQQTIEAGSPLSRSSVSVVNYRSLILGIAQKISRLVQDARVTFPDFADLEISHHYGLERFNEYGLTMITVVNREYCKKILILLPGQAHPEQFHKKKEETFHVLWGEGSISLNGEHHPMKPGDVIVISPGTKHSFSSTTGVIIEEISSTHNSDDSFYTDPLIHANKSRKTYLTHWSMT